MKYHQNESGRPSRWHMNPAQKRRVDVTPPATIRPRHCWVSIVVDRSPESNGQPTAQPVGGLAKMQKRRPVPICNDLHHLAHPCLISTILQPTTTKNLTEGDLCAGSCALTLSLYQPNICHVKGDFLHTREKNVQEIAHQMYVCTSIHDVQEVAREFLKSIISIAYI